MIEKICIFANLSMPYVYEEGFTTLEILKNLIKHTNEIIDEVNKIPAFELKVNNELAKLNEKLVTDINNLKQEILDLFPVEFEKELQKAINNNEFDVLLNPLKSDIEALQTKVNSIESDVTLLKNKVTSLETRTETLETKTETLENTTNELNQNLATKIDDAPADNNTYGRNNNNWVQITGGSGEGIPDAPIDNVLYGRKNGNWDKIPDSINIYKTITDADVPADNTVILNIDEIKDGDCIVIKRSNIGTNTFIKFSENIYTLTLRNGIYQFYNINRTEKTLEIIGYKYNGIYHYFGNYEYIQTNNEVSFDLNDTRNIVYVNTTDTIYGTKTFTTTPKITKAPTTNEEATNKKYVDDSISTLSNSVDTKLTKYVDTENNQEISGLKTFSTIPNISGTPTTSDNATNKNYVDTKVQSAIAELNIDNYVDETSIQTISGLKTFTTIPKFTNAPNTDEEATNKKYVDDSISTLNNSISNSINNKITGISPNSKILYGTTTPENTLGNDGDIYLLIS